MTNKCEEAGMKHAWESSNEMWGFDLLNKNTCGNCGLQKTKHSQTKEWWSYSDGRPNEPIVNVRPV